MDNACAYFGDRSRETGRLTSRCVISLDLSEAHTAADMYGNLVVSVTDRAAPEQGDLCAATRMADIADRRP